LHPLKIQAFPRRTRNLNLASSLMAKHNLDMAQVESATGLDGDGWVEGMAIVSARRSTLFSMVGSLCQEFFFVTSYSMDTRKLARSVGMTGGVVSQQFFGTPANVETARHIFTSLLAAIDRLWHEHRARTSCGRSEKLGFAFGVVEGYRTRLMEERAALIRDRDMNTGRTDTALALQSVIDKTCSAFESRFPGVRTVPRPRFYWSEESHSAGKEAGQKLNLSRPIGGDGRPSVLTGKDRQGKDDPGSHA
jgi:hypothetical protein